MLWQGLPHAKPFVSSWLMAISEHQAREASGTNATCYFLTPSHPPDSEPAAGRVGETSVVLLVTQRQGTADFGKPPYRTAEGTA